MRNEIYKYDVGGNLVYYSGKMTDDSATNEIDEFPLRQVIANEKLERNFDSTEIEKLLRRIISKEITVDEAIEIIKEG